MLRQIIKATKSAVNWCMPMEKCPNCNIIMETKDQVLEPDKTISKEWVSYVCEKCLYFICVNEKTNEVMRPADEEISK